MEMFLVPEGGTMILAQVPAQVPANAKVHLREMSSGHRNQENEQNVNPAMRPLFKDVGFEAETIEMQIYFTVTLGS